MHFNSKFESYLEMFIDSSKCSLCSNSASASLYRDDAVANGIHIYLFYVYVSKPFGICSVCGVSSSSESESPPAEQKHILVLKMYSRRSRSNSSQTINHAEPSSQPATLPRNTARRKHQDDDNMIVYIGAIGSVVRLYGIQILERMEGGGECSWRDVLK